VVGGDKGNQKKFGVFEVFYCRTNSQHDGYHVGSTLQGIVHCAEFGGICECNLTSI